MDATPVAEKAAEYLHDIVEAATEQCINDIGDVIRCLIADLQHYHVSLDVSESCPQPGDRALGRRLATEAIEYVEQAVQEKVPSVIAALDLDDHLTDLDAAAEQVREAICSTTKNIGCPSGKES